MPLEVFVRSIGVAIAAPVAAMVLAATATSTLAETAAETRQLAACARIYAKLCKGIAPGPEMVGKCNRQRPTLAEKIPQKCAQDFQSAVEGYEETRPAR